MSAGRDCLVAAPHPQRQDGVVPDQPGGAGDHAGHRRGCDAPLRAPDDCGPAHGGPDVDGADGEHGAAHGEPTLISVDPVRAQADGWAGDGCPPAAGAPVQRAAACGVRAAPGAPPADGGRRPSASTTSAPSFALPFNPRSVAPRCGASGLSSGSALQTTVMSTSTGCTGWRSGAACFHDGGGELRPPACRGRGVTEVSLPRGPFRFRPSCVPRRGRALCWERCPRRLLHLLVVEGARGTLSPVRGCGAVLRGMASTIGEGRTGCLW